MIKEEGIRTGNHVVPSSLAGETGMWWGSLCLFIVNNSMTHDLDSVTSLGYSTARTEQKGKLIKEKSFIV